MLEKINKYYQEDKLRFILLLALFARLIAVIFSKGYGMHDDHFLIIEASKSWVDGYDYNNWLPWNQKNPTPSGHSFFYVGIHYLIFLFFKLISFENPDYQMYVIRLFHAVYSLLIISLSYKITKKLYAEKQAVTVAWILALAWFMPFLSVRNLVEIVSIPPMLASIWYIIKDDKQTFKKYFLAGLIGGLAFSIRFQTSLFIGGIGLTLLIQKQLKQAVYYGIGAIFSVALIQGGIDIFIWGKPFTEFGEYVRYNLTHKNDYIHGDWFNYILVLSGMLIPPFGLFLFFGMFNTRKKLLILFIPTLIFFLFHSYFPNKQERFIFPVLPQFIILGIIGIDIWINGKFNKNIYKKIFKWSFIFAIIINFILLPFVTTTYSKKARVESMLYLYKKDSTDAILVDAMGKSGYKMVPRFYMGKWPAVNIIRKHSDYKKYRENSTQKYVLFLGNDSLQTRVKRVEQTQQEKLKFEKAFAPGLVDWILYSINKHNANDTIFVYSKISNTGN